MAPALTGGLSRALTRALPAAPSPGGGGGGGGSANRRLTASGSYRISSPGSYRITEEAVAFSIPATASFDYDPFAPTHKMAFDWSAVAYLTPGNTKPSWGDPPNWTPQVLGTVQATGPAASSVVWSIDENDLHTQGLELVTSTPGEATVQIWFDREFHNTGLGPSRTFTLTGSVGGVDQTCDVTLSVDLSAYTSLGLPSNIPGITSRVGCDPAVPLTPFPAHPGPAPAGWEYVVTSYSSFVAGVYTSGLNWYAIRPTTDGASLTNYDLSGFAIRNNGNSGAGYSNITLDNCLIGPGVWPQPLTNSTTTTVNPLAVGSVYADVASISGLGVNAVLTGNSDYPAGTYVKAVGIGMSGNGNGGSAVITGIADTSLLSAGMNVLSGGFVQSATTIASVDSPTQITLSKTLTGSVALSGIYLTFATTGTRITLSNAAVADSGATSTQFITQQGGSQMCVIQLPSASSKTWTFVDCTLDADGVNCPWFINLVEIRHPNQQFQNCLARNMPNDFANANGGVFVDTYMASIGTNNRRANGEVVWVPPGYEVLYGNYAGHCDGVQAFNTNQNVTLTRCYADMRFYHVDPLIEEVVAGATAPYFMQQTTTGTIVVEDSISRGGTYGIQSAAAAGTDALTTYKNCLFDGDANLGQVYSPPRVQLQAFNNKFLLDWVARADASQPGPNPTGAVVYQKGDPYGSTLNPPIVAPANVITVQGSDYIRFGFTAQANTKYEGRWRTTLGPGAWSAWEPFEDQTRLIFVPGGSASPDWAPGTGYDIEIRGYNDTCVTSTGGTRLIADGPVLARSITTAAAPGADADAAAILAAWSTAATVYERDAVYNLVAALKAGANVWNKLGHMMNAAAGPTAAIAEQRSLFNWKAPGSAYAKSGTSPVWRNQYGGGVSAGGMGAKYIDSGWTPGYGGDPLADQNDAFFFRYMVATDGNPSNASDLGNLHNAMAANNGTNMRFQNANGTHDAPTASASPYLGMLVMSRDNGSDYDVYRADPGGTLAAISGSPVSRASATPDNSKIVWLGQNTGVGSITITRSSRGYMAFEGGGRAVTLTQAQELTTALESFLSWFDALPA